VRDEGRKSRPSILAVVIGGSAGVGYAGEAEAQRFGEDLDEEGE
jgi:hypothetical protein